jgi:2-polyprenyl-6-methoxyphenol hydroxylase-like FAD-dependent oxidoreductase
VRSIVLERKLEPAPESRALVLWARTQEIFRDWGAYDALRAAGDFVTEFSAVNALSKRQLVALDFRVLEDVLADPGVIVLPQYRTERILRDLVLADPHCEFRAGIDVRGIEQHADCVDVHVQDGAMERTMRASYVVGCDGAHGIVRHAIGMSLEGVTYDSRVLLSDELLERQAGESPAARIRFDKPGIRAAVRFGPKLWRVMASIGKDETDADALSPEAHRERLRSIFGEGTEATTLWSSIFNIHRRHAQRFLIGRVALAGDAAHVNSPAGGQGMNSGIQDAANLAWKLACALQDGANGAALLETYDIERREMVTDTIERFTDRLTRVGIGFLPRAKQFAIRAASRAVRGRGMQRKLARGLSMLNGRYTRSPIVETTHPLGGRRIDDLILADGMRVNQRRGGDAALVVAGEFSLDLPHIAVPLPPKRWHLRPPAVLIVRPDGCVAYVIEKPTRERIEAAWQRAFCGTIPLVEKMAT